MPPRTARPVEDRRATIQITESRQLGGSAPVRNMGTRHRWRIAHAEANWFLQNLDDDPRGLGPGSSPRDGDEFWQLNAHAGYRFWQNQGEVSIGVRNIFDSNYQLSPLNPYNESQSPCDSGMCHVERLVGYEPHGVV